MDTIPHINWSLDPSQDWEAIRARYEALGRAILSGFTGLELSDPAITDAAIRAMYGRDWYEERVDWQKEGF